MLDLAKINYVDTPEAVAELAARVAEAPRVAIDTEADSLHHYYEKVCLVQITVDGSDYVVDPLARIDLQPLMQALSRPKLLLHGADYDLRMMRRDFGFVAHEIFDTMSAAQLLGYQRFGYAALVEHHLGISLCKQGQKADWSRRPLTDKLLHYAAGDTHYLARIADRLTEELILKGRLSWHEEVCRKLLPQVAEGIREPDAEKQWRIKGWAVLRSPRAQAVLREVWRWRDEEARRADLPPFKIVRNETLIALATWAHAGLDPRSRPSLPRNFVGRRMRTLLEAIERGLTLPESELPKPLAAPRRDQPPPDEQLVANLKQIRDAKARELELDPGVLLPGAAINAIAAALPSDLAGLQSAGNLYDWQTEQLGPRLLEAVEHFRRNPPPAPAQPPKGGGGYWRMRRAARKAAQEGGENVPSAQMENLASDSPMPDDGRSDT